MVISRDYRRRAQATNAESFAVGVGFEPHEGVASLAVFETAALGQTRRPYRDLVYRGRFTAPFREELPKQRPG
jgi:hypothetical protein